MPDAKQPAKDDEFAEMVGAMVGDEKRLAEEVLAITPEKRLEEVGIRLLDESFKLLAIFADSKDALVP